MAVTAASSAETSADATHDATADATFDVAVVGAGVVGCLTARAVLDRWADASVVVLDRQVVGSGATQRSAGLHFPRGSSERVRRMAAFSQRYYRQWRQDDPDLPVYETATTVVADERHHDRLRETYLADAGLKRLDRLDGLDRLPGGLAGLPEGSGAWQVSGGQYADVRGVTDRLAGALRTEAAFAEGTRVTEVSSSGDDVRLTLSTGGQLRASAAVLAPGPWLADPAWRHWTEPLGLRVKKVVALHVERRPRPGDGVVVFEDEDAFLLPLHHRGHWLFSYTCHQWDVSPDGSAHHLTPRDLAEGHAVLRRYAPEFVPATTSGRVFCDAYSPDRTPVVRPVDAAGRVVFAGAANGSGYRLAPAIAAEAAAQLPALPVPRSHT